MIKRNLLALMAVLAGLGLSGCISGGGMYSQAALQQPSQEILDGSIRNPADWDDPRPVVTRRTAKVTIGAVSSVNAGTDGRRVATAAASSPTVYSDEWWAKEDRENQRLKNRMHICRGC
jgi:hypothetical protein